MTCTAHQMAMFHITCTCSPKRCYVLRTAERREPKLTYASVGAGLAISHGSKGKRRASYSHRKGTVTANTPQGWQCQLTRKCRSHRWHVTKSKRR